MKILPLMVAAGSSALLLVSYGAAKGFPGGLLVSQSPTQVSPPPPAPTPSATYAAARQLGWAAAVMVQKPPHPIPTWQQARVKWRKAIRLLESIPADSPTAKLARPQLATYRTNYRIISDRLIQEQTAAAHLETAQKKAWQAAVMVQSAPPSLRLWQRAHQKWQQAIQLLDSAPGQTASAATIQQKRHLYHQNQQAIQQRIAKETQALNVLRQFSQTGKRLHTLADQAFAGKYMETIGLDVQDYAQRVAVLKQALRPLAPQRLGSPAARTNQHPLYTELASILEDYQTALRLWQTYTATHANDADWLPKGGLISDLVAVSPRDSIRLRQKYQIKTLNNGTRVALRFALWDIWRQAGDRITKLERQVQAQNNPQLTTDRDAQAAQPRHTAASSPTGDGPALARSPIGP